MKTQKERAEERRKEKLAQIDEQIASGSLTVRKMTAKERKANPARPKADKDSKRRR